MALQLLDLFETTLSASYTAGGTTLTLTSVSGLPASGDYWISVYDPANAAGTYEVFKVTGAASGNVIPVTGAQATTSSRNHASGQTVYGSVLTAAALTQLKADSGGGGVLSGTYASRPAAGSAGRVYYPTDSLYNQLIDNGTSWDHFYLGRKMTPINLASFAWVNQGGSATVDTTYGYAYIMADNGGNSANMRILKQSLGGLPRTITTLVQSAMLGGNNLTEAGLVLRESSTGKLVTFAIGATGTLHTYSRPNPTTSPTDIHHFDNNYEMKASVYLRLVVTSTTRTCYFSMDGQHWIQPWAADTLAANFTTAPDEVGFEADGWNGVYNIGAAFLTWE
jgi:hypothetical protein